MRMIDELAAAQVGLLTAADAQRAGLTQHQVNRRVDRGEWVRLQRGLYRVAAVAASPVQASLAACLGAGPGAVASHQSAAWLWGLLDSPPDRPTITVPQSRRPTAGGSVVHRTTDPVRTPVLRSGVPCTSPRRTLVDLAGVVPRGQLDQVLDVALGRRLVTLPALTNEHRRLAGRPGVVPLRSVLRERGFTGAPEPSVLESRALRLLHRGGVDPMAVEVVGGEHDEYRLDILLAPRLAMEVDGYAWHFSPEHTSRDEERRNRIRLSGTFLLVYTWRDVTGDGARVLAEVRRALATVC